MRTKNNFLWLAIFLAMAVLYPGVDSQAAEPVELVTLRQEFTAQKKGVVEEELRSEIFDDYIDKLIELESDLRLNKRDMQGVNAVRKEMRAVKKELASPPTSEPVPPLYDLAAAQAIVKKAAAEAVAKKATEEAARKAAAEVAAKKATEEAARKAAAEVAAKKATEEAARKAAAEVAVRKTVEAARKAVAVAAAVVTAAPKPVVAAKPSASNRSGKTHVSNVQGQAAAADFSRHNVYKFDLSRVGKVSTLTFYATGRSNIDSDGKIWLITPGGGREKVGVWEISNVSTVGASSYKDLKAIRHDISKLVTKPGTYKVEFEWTSGLGPLYIYRVELAS